MLIKNKYVKLFALEMAKCRAHKFTRVGGLFGKNPAFQKLGAYLPAGRSNELGVWRFF
jgi:hypothetical protein